MTHHQLMPRNAFEVIDEIKRIRSSNNRNWTDLVCLAYRVAPEEAVAIIAGTYDQDARISKFVKKLVPERSG